MRLPLAALIALALGGCVSLVPPASKLPPRYTLSPADAPVGGPSYDATLAIADARAEGALNTSRIAVLTAPNELRYLRDGEWSDRAPLVFSLLLERSFEAREQLLAVSDRVALPIADYTAYADISAMHVDRSGEVPVATVRFRLRIEAGRSRVLGARSFAATRPVDDATTRAAAQAINVAAAETTREAAAWAMDLIGASEAGR